jgi:hypothetical protein
MGRTFYTKEEAALLAQELALKGHLVQQLSPYHYRIAYGREVWVDWWPTTKTARLNVDTQSHPIFDIRNLEPLLAALHFTTLGFLPQPVNLAPSQDDDSPPWD